MTKKDTRLAVIVCSVGRPDCLRDLVPMLAAQTRPANRVLFVVTCPEDVGFDPSSLFGPATRVETLMSPKGLPCQRNCGLDAVVGDCDIAVFFDDDFMPSRHALDGAERAFNAFPDVNGMTGYLIADGINAPGIPQDEAEARVATWDAAHGAVSESRPIRVIRSGLAGLYGCNMAYRLSSVGATRFDERLPLYGWQEDIDFAARIPGGRIKTDAFAGVHRGAKLGRETAGRRLGYSQIANPWYLWRKGTMSARFAIRLALRNMAANHAKTLRPEPWIDRAARASGNRIALWDIATGRADPGRILAL
jgi:hypothetical protein